MCSSDLAKMAQKAVELMEQAEAPEVYRRYVEENFDWDRTIETELSKYLVAGAGNGGGGGGGRPGY